MALKLATQLNHYHHHQKLLLQVLLLTLQRRQADLTDAGPSGPSGIGSVGAKANNNVKDKVRRKTAKEYKYVSNREGITKTEYLLLAKQCDKLKTPSQHGNARSACWQYFGFQTDSSRGKIINADYYYCKVCLEECQTVTSQARCQTQHANKIQSYTLLTSTNNLTTHLVVKHKLEHCKAAKVNVITK